MISHVKILIMKKFACLLFTVCIALSISITGCKQAADSRIDIIQIEGASWAGNVSSTYGWFGSSTEVEGENKLTLAASDGDLLYITLDDLQFYYRYNAKDGTKLELSFDTLSAVSVYLNGELNYMELSEPSSLEALKALTDPELTQLSSLDISGPLVDDLLPFLKEHESQLKGLSLVLEGGSYFPDLNELLGICRPEFLVLHDSSLLPEPGTDPHFEGLELLWIEEGVPTLSKTVACCGDLESLIISGWEPEPGEILPLSTLKDLQNLTLSESDLYSLENIEFPDALRSLNLIFCDTLSNIDQIAYLPKLCRLSLSACDRVKNLTKLQNLESLRWISLPPSISQQEFHELLGKTKHLELAELLDCQEIENLSPLRQAKDLKVLILLLEEEQLSGLEALTQLEVLVLTEELLDDNEQWVRELRAHLPITKIVPGSAMCLGSGWLLLLLPLVLIFRFIFRQKA
jgi:hypothetical protein